MNYYIAPNATVKITCLQMCRYLPVRFLQEGSRIYSLGPIQRKTLEAEEGRDEYNYGPYILLLSRGGRRKEVY